MLLAIQVTTSKKSVNQGAAQRQSDELQCMPRYRVLSVTEISPQRAGPIPSKCCRAADDSRLVPRQWLEANAL